MRPISGGHTHPTRTQLSSSAAYRRLPFPVPKQDGNGSCHVFPISSAAVRSRSHPTTLGQASQGSTFTRYRNDCHSSCPPPTSSDTTPLSKGIRASRRTLAPIAPRRRRLAVLYLPFQFRICRISLFVPRCIHSRAHARQIPFNCGSTCPCRVTFSLRCSTEYKGNLNFPTVGSSFSRLQSSTARIFHRNRLPAPLPQQSTLSATLPWHEDATHAAIARQVKCFGDNGRRNCWGRRNSLTM
jgi:hypothetical protein